MPAPDVGFVNPVLISQHEVFASTAEAAVQDMITSIHRLARTFANYRGASAQMLSQNAKAPDFRLWSQLMHYAGDGGPMPEHIAAFAWLDPPLQPIAGHCQIVAQLQAL